MIKAGVIGHPIAHSKSPLIHGYWLKKYGIEGEYLAYDIAPDNLEPEIEKLAASGLAGFNVTLPHKQTIMALCNSLSEEAQAIGAVNTITVQNNGTLHGHNTDAFGFAQNLEETIPSFDWTQSGPALVIGAGGAARAVAYALKNKGVPEIRIVNRSLDAANKLADDFGLHPYQWADLQTALKDAGLVIQTTSLGMKGQPPLEIDISPTRPDAVIYDIVYNPLMTDILLQAEQKKRRMVTGIGMLLHQARPAFRSWFGADPEVDAELREKMISGKDK